MRYNLKNAIKNGYDHISIINNFDLLTIFISTMYAKQATMATWLAG